MGWGVKVDLGVGVFMIVLLKKWHVSKVRRDVVRNGWVCIYGVVVVECLS